MNDSRSWFLIALLIFLVASPPSRGAGQLPSNVPITGGTAPTSSAADLAERVPAATPPVNKELLPIYYNVQAIRKDVEVLKATLEEMNQRQKAVVVVQHTEITNQIKEAIDRATAQLLDAIKQSRQP
jgi:hypothetical protein